MSPSPLQPSSPSHSMPEGGADAQWLAVLNELLLGANHALNNRLTALRALVRLIEDAHGRGRVEDALDRELSQLERVGALLQRLPRRATAQPYALHLPDVVREVLAQYRAHGAVQRDVEYHIAADADVPPIWAEEGALARALFVVLARAAAWAGARPGTAVGLRYQCDEARVYLTIEATAGQCDAAAAGGQDGAEGAVRALAAAAGGELIAAAPAGGAGVGLTLAFPTLAGAPRP